MLKSPLTCLLLLTLCSALSAQDPADKSRIIVTSDGEIDDECSMVRFLLYTNEWDVEGIVTSSSQYHWQGHRWAGNDWLDPYLAAYAEVYPNLILHSQDYPTADHLRSVTFLGNVADEGEMEAITPGSEHIVRVLLDESDDRPVWLQAWGGINTIARALKTIEEEHPEKMDYVAGKLRFFFIWEQDDTYQTYIRPTWGKYDIPTIISDQFWAIAYQWDQIIPEDKRKYFESEWMTSHITRDHGPLCSRYKVHAENDKEGWEAGDVKPSGGFRSEGDSPAFLHMIPTGLRSLESPGYGGWGGRYVMVRDSTWLDPITDPDYSYPEGRYYAATSWGHNYMRDEFPERRELMEAYFKPMTRWVEAIQRDFASRADWCTKSFAEANHAPEVQLTTELNLVASPGERITLNAKGTSDPDGDPLTYSWWRYEDADTFAGEVSIEKANRRKATLTIPKDVEKSGTIHIVCEVSDGGTPQLTRYQRVIIDVRP